MPDGTNSVDDIEPGVLRVLQSKEETKAYYNKSADVEQMWVPVEIVLAVKPQ